MNLQQIKVLRTISKIVLLLTGLFLLGYMGYVVYMGVRYKPYKVRVTNVTDSAFTVSWITDTPMTGIVYYGEKDTFLPGPLAWIGKKKAVDDRDSSNAMSECVSKFNKKAVKTKDANFTVDASGFNCNDVKVFKYGKYYTHHITVQNLDAEKEYFFRVGDGVISYGKNSGTYKESEPVGVETFAQKTKNVIKDIGSPNPAYGTIYNIYKDEEGFLREKQNFDSMVFLVAETNGNKYEVLSSVVNMNGGWSIDLSNVRDLDGKLVDLKGTDLEFIAQAENFPAYPDGLLKYSTLALPLHLVGNKEEDWSKEEENIDISHLNIIRSIIAYDDYDEALTTCWGVVNNEYCLSTKRTIGCSGNYPYTSKETCESSLSSSSICALDYSTTVSGSCNKEDCWYEHKTKDGKACELNGIRYVKAKGVDNCRPKGCLNDYNTSREDKKYCVNTEGKLIPIQEGKNQRLNNTNDARCVEEKYCCCGEDGYDIYETLEKKKKTVLMGQSCTSVGCLEEASCSSKNGVNENRSNGGTPAFITSNRKRDTMELNANGERRFCNDPDGCICVFNNLLSIRIPINDYCFYNSENHTVESNSGISSATQIPVEYDFRNSEGIVVRSSYWDYTSGSMLCCRGENGSLAIKRSDKKQQTYVNESYDVSFTYDAPTCPDEGDTIVSWNMCKEYVRKFIYCYDPSEQKSFAYTYIGNEVPKCPAGMNQAQIEVTASHLGYTEEFTSPYTGNIRTGEKYIEVDGIKLYCQKDGTWKETNSNLGPESCTKEYKGDIVPSQSGEDEEKNENTSFHQYKGIFKASAQTDDTKDSIILFPSGGTYEMTTMSGTTGYMIAEKDGAMMIYVNRDGVEGYQSPLDIANPKENEDLFVDSSAVILSTKQLTAAKEIPLKKGINIMSFSFLPSSGFGEEKFSSIDFLELVNRSGNNVSRISYFSGGQWNGGTSYDFEKRETKGVPFDLVPGKGYVVVAERDTTISVPGYEIKESVPVAFSRGWNLVGIHGYSTAYTARTLIESINTIEGLKSDNVTWWPTSRGMYQGYQLINGQSYGQDYPISPLNGYFVRISEFNPKDPSCKTLWWNPGGNYNGQCDK